MFFNFQSFVFLVLIINLVNGDKESSNVIIIGAGSAGIAAASKLFQNGFKNVKILEAENRIGGRVFTTEFNNYSVDLGGQWVHGEKNNVVFELAWPLGLLEKAGLLESLNYEIIDSSGNLMNQTSSHDILSFYFKLKEELDEYSEQTNGSIGEFFTNKFNSYIEEHPEWSENVEEILHLFNMMQIANDAGDSWWEISTTNIKEFHDSEGDYAINWKERGYGTALDLLMKRYPKPEEELPIMNNTILNSQVSLINYENEKVTVETTDGKKYFADHVIVTCSLGVLKAKNNSLFKPSLPAEKQKTIEGLGFGYEGKIYLSFEDPLWNEDTITNVGFTILWTKKELEELEKDPERRWLLGLVGFFFVEHKPRLLFGWISGNYSLDVEKLSDQQVFNQSVSLLRKLVGKHREVPTPTGMLRTTWNSNPNFRGTYSFRSLKSDADNSWHATLAEPIGEKKPVVLFAGEATNPHHFSTVHGAIETGWREADRLIKHYSN